VVSLDAFARYHSAHAEAWEHQALLKARVCAGDRQLGARVIEVAAAAAYALAPPSPQRLHHMRLRMERELANERPPQRYDLKVGRGGLVDVEFAAQFLQMKAGRDQRVRTTETETALVALLSCGYLEPDDADALRAGWDFLRRLEQRLRVAHGSRATLIEEGAPGLVKLARSMGMHDASSLSAEEALIRRYREITEDVRAAYLRVLSP
jgi:glutamate-ammonia-ligase adenylyltransferase